MNEELLPTTPPPALDVPQEMILAIAIGMEDASEIASRYGFDGDRWKVLSVWKPFLDAVAKQKAELEQNGITFRIKAKALTEDVFEDAYKIARSNDATLLQKLEFIKLGAKLGDMEPKASAQVASGPGFSITINITDPPKKTQVVDMPEPEVIEFEPPKLDLKTKPLEENE
jgi:hypothetical protein